MGKSNATTLLRAALLDWFRTAGRDLPWRRTRDPYAIAVSEFMLQQTQVATVLPYYARWLKRFPNFAALAAAPEQDVMSLWQGLGYYARARNLHRLARAVVELHHGVLPSDMEKIRALPGVGPYTAGALASFAFDLPAPAIDANIARVLARILDLQLPVDARLGAERLHEFAVALIGENGARDLNSALMDLGASLCSPRAPQCLVCPVQKFCNATEPERLPRKKPRRATEEMHEDSAWTVRGSGANRAVLLELQTGPRWRGLWKLPPLAQPVTGEPLTALTYPFTHHRVRLRVFSASQTPGENQAWHLFSTLPDLPLTAPHRRAIGAILAS